jgi:hypothetical protein
MHHNAPKQAHPRTGRTTVEGVQRPRTQREQGMQQELEKHQQLLLVAEQLQEDEQHHQ